MTPTSCNDDNNNNNKTTLILIDVQKDFHPGGSLAVPTADEDATRIAQLIRTHGKEYITRIVATLDTHQKLHIAHPCFWYKGCDEYDDDDSKTRKETTTIIHPNPFTIISADDIQKGVWKPRQDLHLPADQWSDMLDPTVFEGVDNVLQEGPDGTKEIDLKKYCLAYAQRLEAKGRFQICIWPEHCLIGSPGHAVVDVVRDALMEWSEATGRTVEWVHKGQHLLTEMYSALEADVPVTTENAFNETLLQSLLARSDKWLVCGQAMSHCVNYTVRDMVKKWPTDKVADIHLLTDCASAVPGFEEAAHKFQNDMREAGVQLITASQAFLG